VSRPCIATEAKNIHPKPRNATSPNSSKIISSQPTPLTITHPSIPSQEGKQTQQSTNYQTESSTSKLPSREGLGVCYVRAQPLQTKTSTQSQQTAPQKNTPSHAPHQKENPSPRNICAKFRRQTLIRTHLIEPPYSLYKITGHVPKAGYLQFKKYEITPISR